MKAIDGITALVTGSTDGIGRRTAHDLAERGAAVLLHGRNAAKGAEAMEEIARATGNDRTFPPWMRCAIWPPGWKARASMC